MSCHAEATVTISGNVTLEDFAFGLAAVDPDAIDRMLAAARKRSGAADFEPSVLVLERAIPCIRAAGGDPDEIRACLEER